MAASLDSFKGWDFFFILCLTIRLFCDIAQWHRSIIELLKPLPSGFLACSMPQASEGWRGYPVALTTQWSEGESLSQRVPEQVFKKETADQTWVVR